MFDVTLGNKLLFSKHRQGRFPEPGEILSILRARGENVGQIEPANHMADGERSSVERGGTCTADCCSADSGES